MLTEPVAAVIQMPKAMESVVSLQRAKAPMDQMVDSILRVKSIEREREKIGD